MLKLSNKASEYSETMNHFQLQQCTVLFLLRVKHFKYLFMFVAVLVNTWCYGQQNLFNIPSGDITPKNKLFYQHQFNMYSLSQLESKAHLVHGVGRHWDIGINFVDLPLRFMKDSSVFDVNSNQKPFYPLLMATLQKQFVLNDRIEINLGTQAGLNVTDRVEKMAFAHFTYGTVRWRPFDKGFIIAGPYYSNDVYIGAPKQAIGWMWGYELPLTRKLSLMGDYISGQNKKSTSTIGAVYDIGKRGQLCLAALVPFPNRSLPAGLVLEINIFGWNFRDSH